MWNDYDVLNFLIALQLSQSQMTCNLLKLSLMMMVIYLHAIHYIWLELGGREGRGSILGKFQGCLIFEFYYFFMWKIKNFFRIYSRSQGSQTQTQVRRGVCPPSPSPNLTYAWIIQQTYHRTDEKKKDCLYFQEFLGIFIVIIIV